MNKLTFDDYAYHAWTTAYYLEDDPSSQYETVQGGFNEELGELLTDTDYPHELTSKLWGLPVEEEISLSLDNDKTSEAGDILYFIAAASALRGFSLRHVATESIERYTGSTPVMQNDTFALFDEVLAHRMSASVPDGYRPNYHTWKMWDFAPFEDGLHIVLREPQYSKGPLRLIPDGRYALERLCSTMGRYISPELNDDNQEFLAAAGLALGGLSIVLQARFNSSLTAAALNNIAKRERRQHAGVLEEGLDKERSRKVGVARSRLTYEEGVQNNLLNAPLPDL